MLKRLRHIGTTGKLASILVLLVMVPAIFFSAYEFSSLSGNESLIADIYSQQLNVVLFSLNQYAWDIVNSWATTVNDALRNGTSPHHNASPDFRSFLNENVGIH